MTELIAFLAFVCGVVAIAMVLDLRERLTATESDLETYHDRIHDDTEIIAQHLAIATRRMDAFIAATERVSSNADVDRSN